MGAEAGTIKTMTGIHRAPFFSKSGASSEKPPPKEYDLGSVTKIVARCAGTAFHAASRLLAAKWLTNSDEAFTAAIANPASWEKRHGPIVTECGEWLWSLGNHNQPNVLVLPEVRFQPRNNGLLRAIAETEME